MLKDKGLEKPTVDVNLRMPTVLRKEVVDYARKEMTSANAVIRRFVRDGLEKEKNRK
jgi:hypothetical protein